MKIKNFKIQGILTAVENLHFRCFQAFKLLWFGCEIQQV